MGSQIDRWNRRAGFLLRKLEEPPAKDQPSPLDLARSTLARWRRLVDTVPHRALAAAAHQGLAKGPVQSAVEKLRRGCLTLAGTAGGGKTVGAAWLAYQGDGSVLWLDAVAVGQAHPDRIAEWRQEIPRHGLVVLDDVGAGSSSGDWSSRKVADVLTAVLERQRTSVVAMNLDRPAFTSTMDGPTGRLTSRLDMPPNVWIAVKVKDRRPGSVEPPDIDVLPEREADAHTLIQSRERLREAHHAYVMADVNVPAVGAAAKALGFPKWSDLDRATAEHDRRLVAVQAEVDHAVAKLRLVVPPTDREPNASEPEPGETQRRRVALLDLLANAAERHACEEADILAQLGRTRRTLGPEDEPALLALLG